MLNEHRDIAAAKQFFTQAIKQHGPPAKLTVDGYPATHTALSELKAKETLPRSTKVRTSKYLNNLIEQDHRRVKQRIHPMLGFRNFRNAAVTISGVELVQEIRKGQLNITQLKGGMRCGCRKYGRPYLPIDGRLIEAIVCTQTLFAPEPPAVAFAPEPLR